MSNTFAISVVVNVGWCSTNDSVEWIRGGDYVSDVQYKVHLNDDANSYDVDVEVTRYGEWLVLFSYYFLVIVLSLVAFCRGVCK